MKKPRPMSLVWFDYASLPTEWHSHYPFVDGQPYVFLGEIKNMKGHCVVSDIKTGQVFSCYDTDNFVEIPEEET